MIDNHLKTEFEEVGTVKKTRILVCAVVLILTGAFSAQAHFGMLIPSDQMVMPQDDANLSLRLMFAHPFEGEGMDLVKPVKFAVKSAGEETDLLSTLKPAEIMGHQAWQTRYRVKRPGVYAFYMEPQPYWEPAEDCYIVHYTKVVVGAFGLEEGWDGEVGLKTEIVPLARPFGLYAGNGFQGVVKVDGKVVPYAEVEVEYYNENGTLKAATDYMVTQVIKADAGGVFTYAAPRPGWWGFAALNTDDKQIKGKDVEIGAVLWINFLEMQ